MYGTAGNYDKPVTSAREGKIDDALTNRPVCLVSN